MDEMIELSGLWSNKSNDGQMYLSGYLGKGKILIFKNKFKTAGSKEPDYRMYLVKGEKKESSKSHEPEDEGLPF